MVTTAMGDDPEQWVRENLAGVQNTVLLALRDLQELYADAVLDSHRDTLNDAAITLCMFGTLLGLGEHCRGA
jgi:hypothetical protein